MRKAVIAIVVIVLFLVALDRVGWVVANYALEGQLKTQLHLDKKPRVRVNGIPLLTQIIGGTYGDIQIDAKDLSSTRLQHVDANVHLRDVHLSLKKLGGWDIDEIPVDHAKAEVTLPYGELARLSGVPGLKASAKGNQIQLTAPVAGIGTATATATPKLAGTVVTVTPGTATVDGRPLGSALAGRFAYRLPVDGLPFQLRLTSLRVTATGLTGTATAQHIVLRKGQFIPVR